jgi:hypothetical protein
LIYGPYTSKQALELMKLQPRQYAVKLFKAQPTPFVALKRLIAQMDGGPAAYEPPTPSPESPPLPGQASLPFTAEE